MKFWKLLLINIFIILLKFSNPLLAQDSSKLYSDLYFEYKFAILDRKSPLDIEYNSIVRKQIERLLSEKSNEISKYQALSKFYFPIFEEYLDKYNLPLELKYLSVVESGLDPTAKSSSGAVGLWQFLYNSAQMFDLKIDSYIDERRDIYKSTDAACKYFKYLYHTFNNWHLVLAAYNGGPGVVRNAIERAGGKTGLWDIYPFLPEQTQNYVPSFLAMNYIFNYLAEHHITTKDTSLFSAELDTVWVNYEVSFEQIAVNIGIPLQTLRLLNPVYKLDIIPENGRNNVLILPSDLITSYLKFENKILTTDTTSINKVVRNKKLIYTVEKGDFLHKIAMKFGCNLKEIKEWNHLKSDFIAPGQQLVIWMGN